MYFTGLQKWPYIFTFFLCIIAKINPGQDPAHFVIGEGIFSGKDIYTMHQDLQGNYWFGTNYGIYKYDGYKFKFIECDEMLSPSIFNLTEGYNGAIYCHNLSGQIFKVKNDECSVYYQIPDSLFSSEIDFQIDKSESLYLMTHHLYRIDVAQKKATKVHLNYPGVNSGRIYRHADGRIAHYQFYATDSLNRLICIDDLDNANSRQFFNMRKGEMPGVFKPLVINDSLYFFSENRTVFFGFRRDSLLPIKAISKSSTMNRLLFANGPWLSDLSSQLYKIDNELNLVNKQHPFLRDFSISSAISDNENNVLFGTFNRGLVVVPKTQVYDINTPPENGLVSALTLGPNGTIIYGTNKGVITIRQPNGVTTNYKTGEAARIEILHYYPATNNIFVFQGKSFLINCSSRQKISSSFSSVKNITAVYPNEYLVSSNRGIAYKSLSKDSLLIKRTRQDYVKKRAQYEFFMNRSTSACYDTLNDIFFYGTSTGLQLSTVDSVYNFRLNGNVVYANDMLFENGKVYITTQSNGLLIFENGKLYKNWRSDVNVRLISNHVENIRSFNKRIIISTDKGMQILNDKGENQAVLNKSEGLYSNQINGFEILNDTLWMLHPKGIQIVALNDFKPTAYTPSVAITKVLVNDAPINTQATPHTFAFQENKFTFQVSAKSLRFKDGITYEYRLIGADKSWQQNVYAENKIDYKTLPPNEYTFEVRANYKNIKSELARFSFVILPPFWMRWWFYPAIILVVVAGFGVFVYFFVRRQQRKNKLRNEINGLKLTAIQAQMNPHFIFNSLNSIQDLVLRNDAENAYSYISKFALMVRNTLNHSKQDFIQLSTEIESLALYLSLEQLRFKTDFSFEITSNVTEQIMIPPLLIQPFVENALVHGLIHKEGVKHLHIHFEFDTAFTCTIEDNGVGRISL